MIYEKTVDILKKMCYTTKGKKKLVKRNAIGSIARDRGQRVHCFVRETTLSGGVQKNKMARWSSG